MNANLDLIENRIRTTREQIVSHTLYSQLKSLDDVKIFMEHHVYAVFDFMSLLKSLQMHLTCTVIPWLPKGNANTRYLINEIVCGEESDVDANGVRMSHFEMYLAAMRQAGAKTEGIEKFIAALKTGSSLEEAFEVGQTPVAAQKFVKTTFGIINNTDIATQAAVFTYGREDLIPNMFYSLVNDINKQFPNKIDQFKYYLDRHIEVDGDHHKVLAKEMLIELIAEGNSDIAAIVSDIEVSLVARRELWSGIEEILKN